MVYDLAKTDEILNSIDLSEKMDNGNLRSSYLIPLLQDIQEEYGFLPRPVLEYISKKSKIPLSRIFGVITFYEQFYLEPQGIHKIRCCRGTACHVKNGQKISAAICEILNINEGETTEDQLFTFETVACLGTCFLAPVIMIDDEYYGNLESGDLESIIRKYKNGEIS